MSTILWSIAALILFFACSITLWIMLYNRLQRLQLQHEHFFQQLNVQLQRRRDLIPRLLGADKKRPSSFAQQLRQAHRQANVAAWQTSEPQNKRIAGMQKAEHELMQALIAFVENSPAPAPAMLQTASQAETSSNNNNQQALITEQLISTENRVAFAQQAYNDAIMRYNQRRKSIPTLWIANFYNFAVANSIQGSASKEYNKLKQRRSAWQR